MAPRLISEWREQRRLRRGTAAYVAALHTEPDAADVEWLASVATNGDADRARWELRYARRSLGLLIAERDALDDRTGSMVARQLRELLQLDRNVAAGMVAVAEQQFNERLSAYRRELAERGKGEGTAARLGRALLAAANPRGIPTPDVVVRAGQIASQYISAANASLRTAFGEAALPDDKPPSAVFGSSRA